MLRLSHPTLSAQIHALEEQLGEKLFVKVGRKLSLTETGRVVYRYADEIFTLGREMVDTVKGRLGGQGLRLDVGTAVFRFLVNSQWVDFGGSYGSASTLQYRLDLGTKF